MRSIASLFPNASQSTVVANPHLLAPNGGSGNKNDVQGNVARFKAKRGVMNKTEAEFALMLEAQKRNGEILRYEYEGITLRWAGIRYTPDFVVFALGESKGSGTQFHQPTDIKLIEVKGQWIKGKFERAIERFRHARTYWPEFAFEMWQKQKSGWKRIH